MKKLAILCYWYNVYNRKQNGYELIGYSNDEIFCNGTYKECVQFAKDNNISIVGEC